jgi:hypothetical protein
MTHDLDIENVDIDMPTLKEVHGDQAIKNMSTKQLCKLQSDMLRSKGKVEIQISLTTMLGNLGIKSNPLKFLKKNHVKEKKGAGNPTSRRKNKQGHSL